MPDIIAGKYEVLETIGRGGMGTVYKARQTNLDRIVAIKMLSEELAADPEFRARFQQEATVVARLNHPNIVQVHDIEPHKNTFCIIMEFVEGENLQHKIDRDVTLPESEVMDIGAQVAQALAYAHTRGIIHRDIKPDNIHVTPKGIAKVMDFGIARFLDSKLKTQTGISMGTPKFMSPEQVTGKNVDGQTDLYSLGVCLYHCLAGRPPFDGENAISVATRHLYEQPEPPSKLNASISPAVEQAVLKALEKQKKDRYKTGTEMADALRAAVNIRTPRNTPTQSDESFSDATMKMQSQAYGSATATAAAATATQTGSERAYAGQTPSEIASAVSQRIASATPARNYPELDQDFRTPNSPTSPELSEQNFKRTLFLFGGFVIVAVALLIFLVLWLRTSDGSGIAGVASPFHARDMDRIESVDEKAHQLLQAGDAVGARQLWLDFRKAHPEVQPQRVATEIENIESLMPAQNSAVAERLYQEAFSALKNQERALAYAYLKSAVKLAPELTRSAVTSAVTTSTLQNLERKLNEAPTAAAEQTAMTTLEQARSQMQAGNWGAETQQLLIQSVENNPRNPQAWETLGDYFQTANNKDAARVMYDEGVSVARETTDKTRIQQKISEIVQ